MRDLNEGLGGEETEAMIVDRGAAREDTRHESPVADPSLPSYPAPPGVAASDDGHKEEGTVREGLLATPSSGDSDAHPATQPTTPTPAGGVAVAETPEERALRAKRPAGSAPATNRGKLPFKKSSGELLEVHELAEIFPPMPNGDFDGLKDSIKAHGLLQPIVRHEGKILDGLHRYRACLELGIDPVFLPWDGPGTALDYVLAMNLNRRHLGQGQRAVAAARLAGLGVGRPDKTARKQAITQQEAADRFRVGRTGVQVAKKIIKNGIPALVEALENGTMGIDEAAQVAEMGEQEQADILRRVAPPVAVPKTPKSPGPRRKQAGPRALPVRGSEDIPHDDPAEGTAVGPANDPAIVLVDDLRPAGEGSATTLVDAHLLVVEMTTADGGPAPPPDHGGTGRDLAEASNPAPRAKLGDECEEGPGVVLAAFGRLCLAIDQSWISAAEAVESCLGSPTLTPIQAQVSKALAALWKVKTSIDKAKDHASGDLSED